MTAKEASSSKYTCYQLREEPGYPFMLDVRLMGGDRYAFPYSYLIWIEYDPSEGITVRFSSYSVFVHGRNLGGLYEGLLTHRVMYIQAEDRRYDTGPESDPFIYEITVKEPDREIQKPRGQ